MNLNNEIKEQPNYNMEDISNCLPCDNPQNKLLQKKALNLVFTKFVKLVQLITKKVKQKRCIVQHINYMEW